MTTYPFSKKNKNIGWADVIVTDSYLVEMFKSLNYINHDAQEFTEACRTGAFL